MGSSGVCCFFFFINCLTYLLLSVFLLFFRGLHNVGGLLCVGLDMKLIQSPLFKTGLYRMSLLLLLLLRRRRLLPSLLLLLLLLLRQSRLLLPASEPVA